MTTTTYERQDGTMHTHTPNGVEGGCVHALERDNGQLPASINGGYPLRYFDEEGSELCATCASDPDANVPAEYFDVFYEGPAFQCADCGTTIESAYGDPDSDEDA